MIKITIISHKDISLPSEKFDGKGGYIQAVKFYNNQNKKIKKQLKSFINKNWDKLKINYEITGIKKCNDYKEWDEEIIKKN